MLETRVGGVDFWAINTDAQALGRSKARGAKVLNIGSTATGGKVQAVKGDLAKIALTQPVCTKEGEKIALSRRVDKHWRLIGWGQIRKGTKIEIVEP